MRSRSHYCLWCCWRGRKGCLGAPQCKRYSRTMSAFFVDNGFLLVSMVLAALLALSLYIPLMAGQLSLANPGFYALGGYIAAFMSTKIFPSESGSYSIGLLLLEMLIAAVVSAMLAVLV